jgi:hypothetical protein
MIVQAVSQRPSRSAPPGNRELIGNTPCAALPMANRQILLFTLLPAPMFHAEPSVWQPLVDSPRCDQATQLITLSCLISLHGFPSVLPAISMDGRSIANHVATSSSD